MTALLHVGVQPEFFKRPGKRAWRPLNEAEQRFVGVWELVDSYDLGPNSEVIRSRGQVPRGILVYDSSRRMAAQVMNDNRGRFRSSDPAEASPDEIKAALTSYTAYFGAFEVNEQERSVLHHMQGSLVPNEISSSRKRFYEFLGNRIKLTTLRCIVWERLGSAC